MCEISPSFSFCSHIASLSFAVKIRFLFWCYQVHQRSCRFALLSPVKIPTLYKYVSITGWFLSTRILGFISIFCYLDFCRCLAWICSLVFLIALFLCGDLRRLKTTLLLPSFQRFKMLFFFFLFNVEFMFDYLKKERLLSLNTHIFYCLIFFTDYQCLCVSSSFFSFPFPRVLISWCWTLSSKDIYLITYGNIVAFQWINLTDITLTK